MRSEEFESSRDRDDRGAGALRALGHIESRRPRDVDDVDLVEVGFDAPGAVVSGEVSVSARPVGRDEFTCMSCFLIHHRSQVSNDGLCADCA